jgi:hypothetical protein
VIASPPGYGPDVMGIQFFHAPVSIRYDSRKAERAYTIRKISEKRLYFFGKRQNIEQNFEVLTAASHQAFNVYPGQQILGQERHTTIGVCSFGVVITIG